LGIVKPEELSTLAEKPYGKGIVEKLSTEYGGKDINELSQNINIKNRANGVAVIEQQEAELDNDISNFNQNYKFTEAVGDADRRYGKVAKVWDMPQINPNDPNSLSEAIESILAHPELSQWEYILTIESDNMPPADGVLKLMQDMDEHPELHCIGGLYFCKGDGGLPLVVV